MLELTLNHEAFRVKARELHGRYTLVEGYSPAAIQPAVTRLGGKIDFALIDALHIYDAVIEDFRGVLPFLSDGAHILFHDAYHQGIDQAIRTVLNENNDLFDCGFITRNPEVYTPVSYQGLHLIRKGSVQGKREALITEAYERTGNAPPHFSREFWKS